MQKLIFTNNLRKTAGKLAMLFALFLFSPGGFFSLNAQCPTGQTEVSLDITDGSFDQEASWTFTNTTTGTLVDSRACGVFATQAYQATYCLVDGDSYEFVAMDDWGDGWGFGSSITFTITEDGSNAGNVSVGAQDGCVIFEQGTVTNGVGGDSVEDCASAFDVELTFTLPITAPDATPIMGCTDPTAVNFDACATVDDESCIAAPVCDGTYSVSPAATIDDTNDPAITITVAEGASNVITDIDVYLDITHTFLADLDITLTSPDGTVIDIFSDNCGGDDNMLLELDDAASALNCDGPGPISGVFMPDNPLAGFNGLLADGDWILTVTDDAGGDNGVLNQVCLNITSEAVTCFQTSGLTAANVTEASADLSWTSNNADPAHTYTVTVVTAGGDPTVPADVVFTSTPATNLEAVTGLMASTDYEFYVTEMCDGTDGDSDPSGPVAFSTTATPGVCDPTYSVSPASVIDDANDPVVTVAVTEGANQVISDVDVYLNITHTFTADLDITLTSPDGTVIDIFSDNCGGDDNIDIELDDDGLALNCDGTGPIFGVVIPDNALAGFNGLPADGTWTLSIVDDAGGDNGVLNQFCLNITTVEATCLQPNALTVANETTTTADLSWTSANPLVTDHMWTVVVVEAGGDPTVPAEVVFTSTVADQMVTATGLTSNTDYDFYVTEMCDAGDGDSSVSGPVAFATIPDFCAGELLQDPGGDGNYPANSGQVVTICPDDPTCEVSLVDFIGDFVIEGGFDVLYVVDDEDLDDVQATPSTLIASDEPATFNGLIAGGYSSRNGAPPTTLVATNPTGCLTIAFFSDGSVNLAGYTAQFDCVVPPAITNDQVTVDATCYDATTAPSIFDPCTCNIPTELTDGVVTTLGNFSEEVDILGVTPGATFDVVDADDVTEGLTIVAGVGAGGDEIVDTNGDGILNAGDMVIDTDGDGDIQITGTHLDGEGYTVSFTDGIFTLTQSNLCNQPRPTVTDFSATYCTNGAPIALEAVDALLSTPESVVFEIDGAVVTELDPAALGVGSFVLDVMFNGDNPPSSDAPATVGCPVVSSFAFTITAGPTALSCNDNVHVSVDDNCSAIITPDVILEGADGCDPSFSVSVMSNTGVDLGDVVDGSSVGESFTVRVTELSSGNFCWGSIIVEDKIAPTIDCGTLVPLPATDFTRIGTFQGNDYFVSTAQDFWTGANAAAIAAGGNLVSINSQEESDWLIAEAAANAPQLANPDDRFWIGLTDDEAFGGTEAGNDPVNGWVWTDGSAFDFQNWNAGEPNDGGAGEDYIEILMSSGQWNDLDVNALRFFVVERPSDAGTVFACTELEGVLDGTIATATPAVTDNCSTIVPEMIGQEVVEGDCGSGFSAQITRTWQATDASGNTAQCEQVLTFVRPTLDDVTIPADVTIDCSVVTDAATAATIGGAGVPTIGGAAIVNSSVCNITSTLVSEIVIDDICPNTYKIRREWLVVDWCATAPDNEILQVQYVKVLDSTGPAVEGGTNQLPAVIPSHAASDNGGEEHEICEGFVTLPALSWTDDCGSATEFTTAIFDLDGSLLASIASNGGSLPNIPLFTPISGQPQYQAVYTATDDCGNTTTYTENFQTEDRVSPVCVLGEITQIAIGNTNYNPQTDDEFEAFINAEVFDDGSYDNCTDVHFLIDRPIFPGDVDADGSLRFYSQNEVFDCSDVGNDNMVFVTVVDDFMWEQINNFWELTSPIRPNIPSAQNGIPEFPQGLLPYDPSNPDAPFTDIEWPDGLNPYLPFVPELELYFSGAQFSNFEGHYNICMVQALVEDKLAPVKVASVTDPAPIACDDFFTNYAPALDIAMANGDMNPQILIDAFGEAVYEDNCEAIVTTSFSVNVNSCGVGAITRTWSATDAAGNDGQTCTQTINVYHVNDWAIEFPQDVTLNCIADQDELEGGNFGEPVVYNDDCELIAISVDDVIYDVVPDACYKVIRTYTAINWCVYDGDNLNDNRVRSTVPAVSTLPGGTNSPTFEDGGNDSTTGLYSDSDFSNDDGIVVYQQVIKVNDEIAPAITNPGTQSFCIDSSTDADGDCDTSIELPEAEVMDCSDDVRTTYTFEGLTSTDNGSDGTGRNFDNVAPGDYTVEVTSVDNCGNQSTISYIVEVRDCKAPTPYCVGGLVVELMPVDENGDGIPDSGMVELWASDLNAGSFDNCTATEDLEVTALVQTPAAAALTPEQILAASEANFMFTCDGDNENYVGQAGANQVYLVIRDEAGNFDYCLTSVFIESVDNVCGNGPDELTIAGALATENGAALATATVSLNNGTSTTSDVNGEYTLMAEMGADVTVIPEHDVYDNTSVTTFDLLQIRKHILTTELLDSPYKMIAADINNNGAITASDLVSARQVILGMATSYPNNNAWAFVDAAYEFPTNWTLTDGYPAVTNINNIANNETANFVAVRIGDVNGTYGFADSADERNSMIIKANDATLAAGQEVTVEFSAADAVLGYQFTLNFNNLEVVSIDGNEENFGVFANAITTSFDAKASDRLFSVTFKATADVTVSDAIALTSNITKAEAYSTNGAMNIALEFAGSQDAEFALYQNSPNPFQGQTVIGFNLPTASAATLTISDVSGKVLSITNGEYTKGYNEVRVSDLGATGVLYYQLDTQNNSAVRKMVVID